jgi:signal peptidase I
VAVEGHRRPLTAPTPQALLRSRRREDRSERRSPGAIGTAVLLALSIAFLITVVRPFVVDVLAIPSSSMEPTLQAGDHVLVNKLAYRVGEPAYGDLALFMDSEGTTSIKRVAGTAGDRVAIRDGVLVVNGERQEEPYVDQEAIDGYFFGPERVPEDSVFVLGDNRDNSRDSRQYGPVPEDDLMGKVLADF